MRKIGIVLIILCASLADISIAYTPTARDEQLLVSCFQQVNNLTQDRSKLAGIAHKTEQFLQQYAPDTHVFYILSALLDYIDEKTTLLSWTIETTVDMISVQEILWTNQTISVSDTYAVVKVIDGDTIDIDYEGEKQRIRLIGIDAPESTTTRYGYTECFGSEARTYLWSLLDGESVSVEFDSTQDRFDKYGRMLAYIVLQWANINEQMILQGYAREYTYNIPYMYQTRFKQAQSDAQRTKRWLRATDTCQWERRSVTAQTIIDQDTSSGCPTEAYCSELTTCEQAHYYLEICHLTRLDSDGDGIPCEALCEK